IDDVPEPLNLLEAGPKEAREASVALLAALDCRLRHVATMEFCQWILLVPDGQRVSEGATDIQHREAGPRNAYILVKKLGKSSSLAWTSVFLPMPAFGKDEFGTLARIGVQFREFKLEIACQNTPSSSKLRVSIADHSRSASTMRRAAWPSP